MRNSPGEAILPRVKAQKKPASFRTAPLPKGSWPLVLIDSKGIRQKARRDYEKVLRDIEKAKAESARFENEDKPGFSKWLHANFGATLTQLRELQSRLDAAHTLVTSVQQEFFYGNYRSISQAYKVVINRRAHPEEMEEEPEPEPGPESGEHDEGDEEPTFNERARGFFDQFQERVEEMQRATRAAAQDKAGNRLKDLYRRLVRRLHPDKGHKLTAQQMEWWHQTQEAYQKGDLEQLESILTLLEVEERGTKETSVSLLARLTANFKKTLRRIKQQLAECRQDLAWNFSRLTDLKPLFERTRTMLESERDDLLHLLRKYEAEIKRWQQAADRPRKQVTARPAGFRDEEWF